MIFFLSSALPTNNNTTTSNGLKQHIHILFRHTYVHIRVQLTTFDTIIILLSYT
eukprot:UN03670